MSSSFVYSELQRFFPQGIVLDLSGNNFVLFMEFPTTNGKQAGICFYEDGVGLYEDNGNFLTKEEYARKVEFAGETGEEYWAKEHTLFGSQPIDGRLFFDNNTLIEIGRTWDKFNRCFRIAMGG
jgi:hypothetical protein